MTPGIYFGIPFDEYRKIEAVGSSALRDILISPLDCWARHVDPEREEPEETAATLRGRAFHAMLLEGMDALTARFYPELNRESFPDVLWSGDELAAECGRLGMAKSGTLLDRAVRLTAAGVAASRLGPLIEASYEEDNEGKTRLPPEDWDRILRAGMVMEQSGILDAFSGGVPEVTIIFEDEKTGLLCKVRIDYLKPKAAYDLKTFANKRGAELETAVAQTFIWERHHIQARFYADAIEVAKRNALPFVRAPKEWDVFEKPISKTLESWVQQDLHDFFMIYHQTGVAPNVVVRRVGEKTGGAKNAYWRSAGAEIRRALDLYAKCREQFGDEPWTFPAVVKDFADEEFPVHLIDQG